MSKYTTQVRFICETANLQTQSTGYDGIDEALEAGRRYIFDFPYTLFDETYKPILENKILRHYYTREISEETVGLWKLRLRSRITEIMPYYNRLYESELLKFNPLWDTDYSRQGDKTGSEDKRETSKNVSDTTGTTGGSSRDDKTAAENTQDYQTTTRTDTGTESRNITQNGSEDTVSGKSTAHSGTDETTTTKTDLADHWDYYSDTPQGTIGFIPGSTGEPQAQGALENQTYLTNVRHVTDDSTGSEDVATTVYGHAITDAGNESRETRSAGTDASEYSSREGSENAGESRKQGTEQNNHTFSENSSRNESSSGSTEGSIRSLEDYAEHVRGKMGSMTYSKMLQEFRETILNIDLMVINNLSDLFFGLWE